MAAIEASDAKCPLPADPEVSFKPGAKSKVDFGARQQDDGSYILDVGDIDGDGAEDFLLSAETEWSANPRPVRSFVVRNNPVSGGFDATDLGEGGLTMRTWAGEILHDPVDGAVFAILGRNGEGPRNLVGEVASIYAVTVEGARVTAQSVYTGDRPVLTASVASCDFDGDGTLEVFFNNYGHVADEDPKSAVLILQRIDGEWREADARRWFAPEFPRPGARNYVQFADLDGDGRCDFLMAHEVAKWNDDNTLTFPGETEAYVMLNEGGSFTHNRPIDLPDPHFGTDSAFFAVEALKEGDADPLVFSVADAFTQGLGGRTHFDGHFIQVWRFTDGAFVDVTAEVIDRQLGERTANHHYLRFTDIDGDGDLDFYFSRYDTLIAWYRNRGGRFTRETVRKVEGKAVSAAFLRMPGKLCADLLVISNRGTLQRFTCS